MSIQYVIVGRSIKGTSRGLIVRVIGPFYRMRDIEKFVEDLNKQNNGTPQKGMVWRKVSDIFYMDDERHNRYDVVEMMPSDTYVHEYRSASYPH